MTQLTQSTQSLSLQDIEVARTKIRHTAIETPCLRAEALSIHCGADIYLKYETLQRTGSFKARGALNKLLSLSTAERAAGVIAASAGNHAQGVAFAAASVNVASLIVMPTTTPLIKISQTRGWGAQVELFGETFDQAYQRARELQQKSGSIFVHPFDDYTVMAGQGTAGLEIVEQVPDLDAVVVPIGGGGLISGIATAVQESRPEVEIYGVQSQAAPSMYESLRHGKIFPCESQASIAEGIVVKRPGEKTFPIIRDRVKEIALVSEEDIEAAIFELLENGKVVAEGAGAAGFAAMFRHRLPKLEGKKVVVLLCGANIDLNILERVIERSLVKQHRVVRVGIELRDRPGALGELLTLVGDLQANVLRIQHNRAFTDSSFWRTEVELTLETRDREHIDELLSELSTAGHSLTTH